MTLRDPARNRAVRGGGGRVATCRHEHDAAAAPIARGRRLALHVVRQRRGGEGPTVRMPIGTRRLGPGQLVVLPAGQVHALSARVASAVLVTLLLHGGDAGQGGGRDKAGRR